MDAKLAEMMAIRSAQDRGDFKKVGGGGGGVGGVGAEAATAAPEPQAAGSVASTSWGSLHIS